MGDWIFDRLGWIFGGILLAFVGLFFFAIRADDRARAEFMAECQQERKQYECTAMWRSGNRDVAPVPVVIPMGRR